MDKCVETHFIERKKLLADDLESLLSKFKDFEFEEENLKKLTNEKGIIFYFDPEISEGIIGIIAFKLKSQNTINIYRFMIKIIFKNIIF